MNKSHQLLSSSFERRLKHLMVQLLTKFETEFYNIKDTQKGSLFRHDLKTAVNDVIRASRDELRDYQVEYRPLRIGDDNRLCMTAEFISSIKQIEFTDKPSIKIKASKDKIKILNALREELGCGILYYLSDAAILEIVGLNECINKVVPIMDNYTFNSAVRAKYTDWRYDLVNQYIGVRDHEGI